MYIHKTMIEGQLKAMDHIFIQSEKDLLQSITGIMEYTGVIRYTDDAFILEFGMKAMRLMLQHI